MTLWRVGFDRATRSFAAGQMAFGRTQVWMNLWSLPVGRDGLVSGAPERLTFTPYRKGSASISRDGRTLLYSADGGSGFSLFVHDIPSGKEREVASGAFLGMLRPDRDRFAYARTDGSPGRADSWNGMVVAVPGPDRGRDGLGAISRPRGNKLGLSAKQL